MQCGQFHSKFIFFITYYNEHILRKTIKKFHLKIFIYRSKKGHCYTVNEKLFINN